MFEKEIFGKIEEYLKQDSSCDPLLVAGDSFKLLDVLPPLSIDCIITSPPYFRKRDYGCCSLGQEDNAQAYVNSLLGIIGKLHSVLKDEGSLWLNLGDTYINKQLMNIPNRVAIAMQDRQGWVLKNAVIWDKLRPQPSSATDHLPSQYETIFHFTKKVDGYYYDADALRRKPNSSSIHKGAVVTSTGVRGVNYARKIEISKLLTPKEKQEAKKELKKALAMVKKGEIFDFRMVIRGTRTINGDSGALNGRASELQQKGFYFLYYNPDGSLMPDIWEIGVRREAYWNTHPATFPIDLVRNPIALTCPPMGVVLDPFCGSGTVNQAAFEMGRKSIGIDICQKYIDIARKRLNVH